MKFCLQIGRITQDPATLLRIEMSYEKLTKQEKQVVDALMDGAGCSKGLKRMDALAKELGWSASWTRDLVRAVQHKYGIDWRQYVPTVRIVYLRAKELGLL